MKRPVRILLTVVAVIAVIVFVFCILFIVQYVRGRSVSDKLGSGVRSGQVVEPLDPQDDGKYMATTVSRMRTGRFIGHFSFVQNGKKAP